MVTLLPCGFPPCGSPCLGTFRPRAWACVWWPSSPGIERYLLVRPPFVDTPCACSECCVCTCVRASVCSAPVLTTPCVSDAVSAPDPQLCALVRPSFSWAFPVGHPVPLRASGSTGCPTAPWEWGAPAVPQAFAHLPPPLPQAWLVGACGSRPVPCPGEDVGVPLACCSCCQWGQPLAGLLAWHPVFPKSTVWCQGFWDPGNWGGRSLIGGEEA